MLDIAAVLDDLEETFESRGRQQKRQFVRSVGARRVSVFAEPAVRHKGSAGSRTGPDGAARTMTATASDFAFLFAATKCRALGSRASSIGC